MTEYLTHAEVAALLRTTPNSLHALYARRRPYLPPRQKFGSRLLYRREDVLASLKPAEQ
jgi:DNA-binding transcriptional MerR regulator